MFWLSIVVWVCVSPAWAQSLRLPAILSDHAVLQRDMPVPVWGWAEPGTAVTVQFKDQSLTTRAGDTGRWRVDLASLDADAQPAMLTVTSGGATLTVQDVVVGEVWLCAGQSNMEMPVGKAADAEREVADADWPLIRHLKAPHNVQMRPQDDLSAAWTVCSPKTVSTYTAVGYYFGLRLQQELGVPIGLLNCSWGGTRIEPWTPIEGFAAVPALSDIHDNVLLRLPGSDRYEAQAGQYLAETAQWLSEAQRQLAAHETILPPPMYPDAIRPFTDRQDPTTLYNGMVAPLAPFAVRGVIWYQGEANRKDAIAYVDKTRALLAGWRGAWHNDALPFYYVQIAPFRYSSEVPYVVPAFWEAQAAIETTLPHTGMVVINDIATVNDIHPPNKQDVGLRLANMALHRTYGRDDALDSGPRFAELQRKGDKLRVRFDHVGTGLATRDGQPVSHFEVAGSSQPWVAARARIVAPDTLEVWSDEVVEPRAIRFAWHKLAEPNLVNSAGLPTSAFCAGDAPDPGPIGLHVPEAVGYEVVYVLDLNRLGDEITYDVDRHAQVTKPFDRVAYYLELGDGFWRTNWVFVSMGAFTDDAGKLGVPTVASGANFQRNVEHVTVRSNDANLSNGDDLRGNIEFWPNSYGMTNGAHVPGARDNAYDTGDQPGPHIDGTGCMQVHLAEPVATVFALNNWKAGNDADLGIGTNPNGQPDWTLSATAKQHKVRRLVVLVRVSE